MKAIVVSFLYIFMFVGCSADTYDESKSITEIVTDLTTKLTEVSTSTDNNYIKVQALSMINILQYETYFDNSYKAPLIDMYKYISDDGHERPFTKIITYQEGYRPFVISWKSKHDNKISFAWVNVPENWDPEKKYPVYIELHGLWNVAANRITFMAYPHQASNKMVRSFKNGIHINPWARGNLWYEDISEYDVLEAIDEVGKVFKIDTANKYILGHSMGGYGAWHLGTKYPNEWAGIGIHAGALDYSSEFESPLTLENVQKIKNIPLFIICGDQDSFLKVNTKLYTLLENAGHTKHAMQTFSGGHEYKQSSVDQIFKWFKMVK